MSSCSRLTASGLVMIDRLRFREHRTVRQIAAVIGRIVHRQPRVEAQPVEPVQRERVVPPVPSRALEDRSVDRRAVLLRAGRATPSRQAAPPHPGACVRRAAARGQDRPHMGQRQRVRAPPVGRRVDGHAGLSARSVIVWSHGGRIAIGRMPGRAVSACRASRQPHDARRSFQFRRAG